MRWLKLGGGVALLLAGGLVAVLNARNLGIVVAGLPFILGGGALALWGWRTVGERVIKDSPSPAGGKAARINALVFSPGSVTLEHVDNPPGPEHLHRNSGAWLHWVERLEDGSLRSRDLPDVGDADRYYSPREFAGPVSMPLNAKLFRPRPDRVKKVSVLVLGVLVGVAFIVIIAMSGGGSSG